MKKNKRKERRMALKKSRFKTVTDEQQSNELKPKRKYTRRKLNEPEI